jgi:acyl dehydratase
MALNKDLVGKSYGEKTYEVTAEAIEKYARATNDENPRYLGGGDDVVATPVFPVVPSFEAFMSATMDPELNADVMRLVHGTEEHVLHAPIRPGDTLTISSELESVESKETGETFTVRGTQKNQNGDLVAEVRGTMFIRGKGSGSKGASGGAEEPQREVVFEESTKVDEDQTVRYAEASGDHNPIHVDENIAKMAGLPRTINHGMCTMAIATKAAVNGLADGDPTRIKRVSVRFSKPVFPGEEITTKLWPEGESGGSKVYGFETYNQDGDAVIKNGVVEVSS